MKVWRDRDGRLLIEISTEGIYVILSVVFSYVYALLLHLMGYIQ